MSEGPLSTKKPTNTEKRKKGSNQEPPNSSPPFMIAHEAPLSTLLWMDVKFLACNDKRHGHRIACEDCPWVKTPKHVSKINVKVKETCFINDKIWMEQFLRKDIYLIYSPAPKIDFLHAFDKDAHQMEQSWDHPMTDEVKQRIQNINHFVLSQEMWSRHSYVKQTHLVSPGVWFWRDHFISQRHSFLEFWNKDLGSDCLSLHHMSLPRTI